MQRDLSALPPRSSLSPYSGGIIWALRDRDFTAITRISWQFCRGLEVVDFANCFMRKVLWHVTPISLTSTRSRWQSRVALSVSLLSVSLETFVHDLFRCITVATRDLYPR